MPVTIRRFSGGPVGEENCTPIDPFPPRGHRRPGTYNTAEVIAAFETSERNIWRMVKAAGVKLRRGGRYRWFTRDQIFEFLGPLIRPEKGNGPPP